MIACGLMSRSGFSKQLPFRGMRFVNVPRSLKLMALGALLIAVALDKVDAVLAVIQTTGISVVLTGEVRPASTS